MSASAEFFDLGGNTERPTSPPEPCITEADLDALRARLREEIDEDMGEPHWWRKQIAAGGQISSCAVVALAVMSQDVTPSQSLDEVRELELRRREREAFLDAV